MTFTQLTCPNCSANLEVEDSLDTVFCKYCGTKIVMSGLDKNVVRAKANLKLADRVLEYQEQRHKAYMEREAIAHKGKMTVLYIAIGIFVACVIALMTMYR